MIGRGFHHDSRTDQRRNLLDDRHKFVRPTQSAAYPTSSRAQFPVLKSLANNFRHANVAASEPSVLRIARLAAGLVLKFP